MEERHMPTPAKKPAARKPAAKKPAAKKPAAKKAVARKPAAKAAAARKPAAKKPAAKKPAAKKPAAKRAGVTPKVVADRTAGLSDDVLKSLDRGQRAALEAVRKFTETVDEALPSRGSRPSQGEKVIAAALEMAENLVKTQYDFLRTVVKSADRELTGGKKKK
jgi:hypothetical protein